ncbi:IclR family transcriptional regulator [Sphingomonas sp.]|jgi:DNA-binding IclR family transcriptional regulator|uniref:IclR family transcriptional regulator n=1 Tax=Sphingomonas sp. TaxID=28214 RepID=UPI002EDA5293
MSDPNDSPAAPTQAGSQTLLRGLDVLESVADGPVSLADLSARLGLNRSTTHRLANNLVNRRYLTFVPRLGYRFGPKLLELGFLAQQQTDLIQIARPHLESLAASTDDTVHLGILEDGRALYLDKIPGRRRVEISSRVGDRQPLTSTGLGKALLLDSDPRDWQRMFEEDGPATPRGLSFDVWRDRMTGYVASGCAFDLEENQDQIRCVAAPVRDASGDIVAALSVSSAAQYIDDGRMAALCAEVLAATGAISSDLGHTPDPVHGARKPRVRR